VSDVSHADVFDRQRDRGRRQLALRQVRAALGCRATGGGREVWRVARRCRPARRHAVTLAAERLDAIALTRALVTTSSQVWPLVARGPWRRAAAVIGELFAAVGVVLCIPLAILAVGIPIVLGVRLLLWIVGLL
jgi:hypothetical protein